MGELLSFPPSLAACFGDADGTIEGASKPPQLLLPDTR